MGVEVVQDEKEKQPFDGSQVRNLPDDMVPRWAKKNPIRLQRLQDQGYVFVNSTTAKGVKLVEDPRTGEVKIPDGSRHRGDMVLMMIPRDKYEARQAAKRGEARRRVEGEKESTKEQLRRAGNQVIDEPGDGKGYNSRFDEKDYKEAQAEASAKARERR